LGGGNTKNPKPKPKPISNQTTTFSIRQNKRVAAPYWFLIFLLPWPLPSRSSSSSPLTAIFIFPIQPPHRSPIFFPFFQPTTQSPSLLIFQPPVLLPSSAAACEPTGHQRRWCVGFAAFIRNWAWIHAPPAVGARGATRRHCSNIVPEGLYFFFVIFRHCCVYLDYCLGYF
jgi:hypothetical protein